MLKTLFFISYLNFSSEKAIFRIVRVDQIKLLNEISSSDNLKTSIRVNISDFEEDITSLIKHQFLLKHKWLLIQYITNQLGFSIANNWFMSSTC